MPIMVAERTLAGQGRLAPSFQHLRDAIILADPTSIYHDPPHIIVAFGMSQINSCLFRFQLLGRFEFAAILINIMFQCWV
jgi:hypothetical protein